MIIINNRCSPWMSLLSCMQTDVRAFLDTLPVLGHRRFQRAVFYCCTIFWINARRQDSGCLILGLLYLCIPLSLISVLIPDQPCADLDTVIVDVLFVLVSRLYLPKDHFRVQQHMLWITFDRNTAERGIQCFAHALAYAHCTKHRWLLVLSWVTTKEHHRHLSTYVLNINLLYGAL